MDLQACGDLAVDRAQELQELDVAVAREALADHRPGQDIPRGEQGGRAIALVVMGLRARPAWLGDGWVRSSAWIWSRSPTGSDTGRRHRRASPQKAGVVESLNVSRRCGCTPHADAFTVREAQEIGRARLQTV
jgi:hypothetical protein